MQLCSRCTLSAHLGRSGESGLAPGRIGPSFAVVYNKVVAFLLPKVLRLVSVRGGSQVEGAGDRMHITRLFSVNSADNYHMCSNGHYTNFVLGSWQDKDHLMSDLTDPDICYHLQLSRVVPRKDLGCSGSGVTQPSS